MTQTAAAVAGPDAIVNALHALGATPAARARIVAALRDCEPLLAAPGVNVRDAITGPIVDALHTPGEPIAVTLESGIEFTTRYSSQIARDVVIRAVDHPDHIFEPQTTKTLLHLARNARNVVVGGAYSGDHAILIAHAIADAGGVVHAFEPNADQQRMLRDNMERNHLKNLRPLALGLWDDESTRLAFVGPDALASTTPRADGDIEVTTIDAYGARLALPSIDLIMLDIEGSELAALRGARGYLESEKPPAIVFEIHRTYMDWPDGLERTEIGAFLTGLGYGLYGIRDFQSHVAMAGMAVELVPAAGAYIDGPPHGFNMLAVRDPAIVADPFFRIVGNVSPKLLHHRDPALHYPSEWQAR